MITVHMEYTNEYGSDHIVDRTFADSDDALFFLAGYIGTWPTTITKLEVK